MPVAKPNAGTCRPDVLPPSVMHELSKLQDNMPTFPTTDARRMIEKELGQNIEAVFSEFSARPVAAASLAQVYRARLHSTGQEVAVKVQRPGALSTISKVRLTSPVCKYECASSKPKCSACSAKYSTCSTCVCIMTRCTASRLLHAQTFETQGPVPAGRCIPMKQLCATTCACPSACMCGIACCMHRTT